jgi:hypothetical protein
MASSCPGIFLVLTKRRSEVTTHRVGEGGGTRRNSSRVIATADGAVVMRST